MTKKVLKFGGTSVGSIERIQHVANIIKKEHDSGNKIIAIVSAMSGKTNELLKLSKNISENFTWSRCAQEVVDMYRATIAKNANIQLTNEDNST